MVAIARIAVILAVFFLVRFAFAHQHRSQSDISDSDSASSLQENSVSDNEESNEKVLIRSGVPLRGRTIHQTAWSEEEKVSVPKEDSSQQPSDQNSKEKVNNNWVLTDAINYILSFIYGTEIDESAIISNKLAENSNKNINVPKNLDDRRNHQSTIKIKDQNEKSEDIPMLNKDSDLETTPGYSKVNLQNQDIEWLRNEIASFSDEYDYTESDFENSDISNEITNSEYEDASYKNEDSGIISKDTVNQVPGLVVNDTEDNPMRNIIVKPFTESREREPEFVSVTKSQESDQGRENHPHGKSQEDDIQPPGITKSYSDERNIKHYNGDDKNIFQSTNRPPIQHSKSETMKRIIGKENFSQNTNSPKEFFSVEDIIPEESMEENMMEGNINYHKNDGENFHATTERTTIENINIEIPPPTSPLQNKRQSQKKDLSSKLKLSTQTEKPKVLMDERKEGMKHEANRLFATTENFNKPQTKKEFKNTNYVTQATVKLTNRGPTSRPLKISSNNGKKDINNKNVSKLQNKSESTHIKPSRFPNIKPLKDQQKMHLKSKPSYLEDVYLDLEPDEDVRSYNYLLDSYEFIRVGNNNNKVETKHDSSVYVIIKDKERSSAKESSTVLSVPLNPFQNQKEVEVIDKSHENFDTILEYLYKNSNNSFILSLKENNSSGI